LTQIRVPASRPAHTAPEEKRQAETTMKTPNHHTLLLAAAIALGAVLAVASVALAVGHAGAGAPAPQPQSPMSVPF
jgi:hypothetical protein